MRDSALPSAANSNNPHYQAKVFVCVSVQYISGHMLIITLIMMRSIGF